MDGQGPRLVRAAADRQGRAVLLPVALRQARGAPGLGEGAAGGGDARLRPRGSPRRTAAPGGPQRPHRRSPRGAPEGGGAGLGLVVLVERAARQLDGAPRAARRRPGRSGGGAPGRRARGPPGARPLARHAGRGVDAPVARLVRRAARRPPGPVRGGRVARRSAAPEGALRGPLLAAGQREGGDGRSCRSAPGAPRRGPCRSLSAWREPGRRTPPSCLRTHRAAGGPAARRG